MSDEALRKVEEAREEMHDLKRILTALSKDVHELSGDMKLLREIVVDGGNGRVSVVERLTAIESLAKILSDSAASTRKVVEAMRVRWESRLWDILRPLLLIGAGGAAGAASSALF